VFQSLSIKDLHRPTLILLFSCIVLLVYASFSSPFASRVSIYEILIGIASIILLAISTKYAFNVTAFCKSIVATYLSFFFLFSLGLFSFLRLQNDVYSFWRDLISLCFFLFLIPSFLIHAFSDQDTHFAKYFPECLVLGGLIQSIRSVFNSQIAEQGGFALLGKSTLEGDRLWFQYDLLVIFACIYSIYCLARLFSGSATISLNRLTYSLLFLYRLFCILIPFISFLFILQRAPLILVVGSCVFSVYLNRLQIKLIVVNNSIILLLFSFLIISLLILSLIALQPGGIVSDFVRALSNKSSNQSGVFYKLREIPFILDLASPLNILLGHGLGSVYYNPELNQVVRFTHNIFTYIIFKFGILGLLSIFGAFGIKLCHSFAKIFKLLSLQNLSPIAIEPFIFAKLAAFLSLLITLLQPSYKALSFPFILGLFIA